MQRRLTVREMRCGGGIVARGVRARLPAWGGGRLGMPGLTAWATCLVIAACGPGGDGPGESDETGRPAATEPWTPGLATELRAMHEQDQAVREGLGPEAVADTAFMGRMVRTDSAHSRRLRELVERHGWPRASDVGEEAAKGAFLVVQHTPFHDWQRDMLPLVEEAVQAGELDAQDYALLFDRVQVRQGRPQRYGTQLSTGDDGRLHLDPVEDPAAVDSLRAGLGLQPLSDYLDLIEEVTGMEVAREGGRD